MYYFSPKKIVKFFVDPSPPVSSPLFPNCHYMTNISLGIFFLWNMFRNAYYSYFHSKACFFIVALYRICFIVWHMFHCMAYVSYFIFFLFSWYGMFLLCHMFHCMACFIIVALLWHVDPATSRQACGKWTACIKRDFTKLPVIQKRVNSKIEIGK